MTGTVVANRTNMNGLSVKFVTGRSSMAQAAAALGLSGSNRKMSLMKGRTQPAGNLITSVINAPAIPNSLGTGICRWVNSTNGNVSVTIGHPYLKPYVTGGQTRGFFVSRTTTAPGLGGGSVAEFKFRGTNYFNYNNAHHFAIILRGKITPTMLSGKGAVIGSVQGYPGHSGVCKPTSKPNTMSVESFWEGGNCVFGDMPNPPTLVNGVIYSAKVIVNASRKTIRIRIRDESGSINADQTINDPFFMNSGLDLNSQIDFGIGSVNDNRSWTMEFGDISYYNFN